MSDTATQAGQRTDYEWVFRYGIRTVTRPGPDGRPETVEVPLTREQYLHPDEDDRFMTKPWHSINMKYLAEVFEAALNGRPGVVVLMDNGVAFGGGTRSVRPDVTVFVDSQRPFDIMQGTFDVSGMGATPLLVVECTSPSTRDVDLEDKAPLYHRAGVPVYAVVDYRSDDDPLDVHLLVYRRTPEGYVQIPTDERGWVWLAPFRMWLALEGRLARCYDEAGAPAPTYVEAIRERKQADALYEQMSAEFESEVTARQEANRRAEQDRQARAEAETRADQERQARLDAEAKLQEVLAELARLKGTP